jgi:hypothetical protein
MGLLVAIEHRAAARHRTADQGTVQAPLHKASANAVDRDRSDIQGLADLQVGPGRAEGATVGLQQDARPRQLASRRLPLGEERLPGVGVPPRTTAPRTSCSRSDSFPETGQGHPHWIEVRGTYQ